MGVVRLGLVLIVLLGGGRSLLAQGAAVVQLPSYSTFGVNTSVSVPDRGSASLGGVGSASTGSTAFGPALGPRNRGLGRNLSSSTTSVHATIHDLDALDRATLDWANGRQTTRRSPAGTNAAMRRLNAARQSSAGQVPAGGVAEARRQRAADKQGERAEALDDIKHARHAAAAGKTSVAAMFYKAAARHATGELKSQIEKEASALARTP